MSFAMGNPELYQLCFERPVPGFVPSPESLELSFGLLNRSYGRVEQLKNEIEIDLSSEQIVNLVIAIAHPKGEWKGLRPSVGPTPSRKRGAAAAWQTSLPIAPANHRAPSFQS